MHAGFQRLAMKSEYKMTKILYPYHLEITAIDTFTHFPQNTDLTVSPFIFNIFIIFNILNIS